MESIDIGQASQLINQLSEIKTQLGQVSDRLSKIEGQLSEQAALKERIARLESSQLLVADTHRYKRLQDYLAAGEWFEADKETIHLIQDVADQPDLEELRPDDIKRFPCNALTVINQLWLNSSHGRFGFSVQVQIYQELGGDINSTVAKDQALIEKWGERLGWRANNQWLPCNELDYSLNAPIGCHPSRWWNSPYGSRMTNFFLARLLTCQL